MFNKTIIILFFFALISCNSARKPLLSKPLYEILFNSDNGGAPFQFYEIVTETKEFSMLLKDKKIKPYVKKEDINSCNFILVNMGEKSKLGYIISIENIEELSDKIIIKIKEIEPQLATASQTTKPCSVIKIKSKKAIEIIQ
ncbi:MAG: hypothetical protein RIQ59_2005 [Bacteroidota bacterium]|jgi:hypothetical protein